ncbi:unnamed protein product, partial [Choristocarpus tenellus]
MNILVVNNYRCSTVLVKCSPTLLTLVIFVVHTKVFGYELTAVSGFTTMAIINQLFLPLFLLPDSMNFCIQGHASIKRLEAFLCSRDGDMPIHRNKVM